MICSKIVDYNTLVIFKPNKVSAIYENKENNKAETMLLYVLPYSYDLLSVLIIYSSPLGLHFSILNFIYMNILFSCVFIWTSEEVIWSHGTTVKQL